VKLNTPDKHAKEPCRHAKQAFYIIFFDAQVSEKENILANTEEAL